MASFALKPFAGSEILLDCSERLPVSFTFVLTLEVITDSGSRPAAYKS